jgi:hypothetical protein
MKFKILKPSKAGLKVFNPATGLHLKPEGEEVAMSNYWHRMIKCGDAVETAPAPEKKKETQPSKKNNSEV